MGNVVVLYISQRRLNKALVFLTGEIIVLYNNKQIEIESERQFMEIMRELWAFLRVRKKFWLAPIIIALLFLAAIFWLAGTSGVVSPFIYML